MNGTLDLKKETKQIELKTLFQPEYPILYIFNNVHWMFF